MYLCNSNSETKISLTGGNSVHDLWGFDLLLNKFNLHKKGIIIEKTKNLGRAMYIPLQMKNLHS